MRNILLKLFGKEDVEIDESSFTSHMNITYKTDSDNDKHKLNIFTPKATSRDDTSSLLPVVIFVHGGSWRRGDRNHVMDVYNRFTKRLCMATQYVAVNLSYRLSPQVKHPDHLSDILYALKFINENITEYGGDNNKVIITGHSAGGHLISLATFFIQSPELFSKLRMNFDYTFPTDFIKAWVPICAVFDITKLSTMNFLVRKLIVTPAFEPDDEESTEQSYDRSSPIYYLRQLVEAGVDLPPMMCFNAESDYGLEEHAKEVTDLLGINHKYRYKRYSNTGHSSIIGLRSSFGIAHTPLIEDIAEFCSCVMEKGLDDAIATSNTTTTQVESTSNDTLSLQSENSYI